MIKTSKCPAENNVTLKLLYAWHSYERGKYVKQVSVNTLVNPCKMIFTQQIGFRDTNIYENKLDKCFTVSLYESLP